MDVYDRLGVKKRINGAGLVTRLGGSLMPPEVLEAMVEAAGAFVDMAELQARASAIIADVTGAEAGLVTTGAAAALTLGTAACLTGLDDAAAALPPLERLRRLVAEGADLVAVSGGKALRGPQSTGILCGRRDLIAAAALQQLDMDVAPETWSPPAFLVPGGRLSGIPHHGIGRGFKAGKEEIVALLVALQRFVTVDLRMEAALATRRLEAIAAALAGLPHVVTRLRPEAETGRFPLLEVALDERGLGQTAAAVSRGPQAGA